MTAKIDNPQVQAVFDAFPPRVRTGLLKLRELINEVAESSEDIGPIREELRWGQPSYLTKTGSTLRLGISKQGGFAVFAHCQTTIISDFERMFPGDFEIEGNRAVQFAEDTQIDTDKLRFLIRHALTYKLKHSSP
ncbi:MAG: DUF1801 domain-containing protein [Rhodobacteraceae bacterium]|nr:DUF1801 domain-containing protein [Paracoccaceae bacterium]